MARTHKALHFQTQEAVFLTGLLLSDGGSTIFGVSITNGLRLWAP